MALHWAGSRRCISLLHWGAWSCSTADVASLVGKEAAGAQEAVFELGMAKDLFRTLHGQWESCAAASDLEELVSAGSSPSSALASTTK